MTEKTDAARAERPNSENVDLTKRGRRCGVPLTDRGEEPAIKIEAKFWIEFEVEDTSNPRHTLTRALMRAERGLKEIIEEGKAGSGAGTGIKRNSTKIKVKSKFVE